MTSKREYHLIKNTTYFRGSSEKGLGEKIKRNHIHQREYVSLLIRFVEDLRNRKIQIGAIYASDLFQSRTVVTLNQTIRDPIIHVSFHFLKVFRHSYENVHFYSRRHRQIVERIHKSRFMLKLYSLPKLSLIFVKQ